MESIFLVWHKGADVSRPLLVGVYPDRSAANNAADAYADFETNEKNRFLFHGCVYYKLPNDGDVYVQEQRFGRASL